MKRTSLMFPNGDYLLIHILRVTHFKRSHGCTDPGAGTENLERGGGGTLASYINTNYFTENSLKIIGNFTEKGGAAHSDPPLNPPMISINDQLTT